MAGEAVRPDADLAHEARRPGLDEDRDAGDEGRSREEGRESREEGLAEHGAALQAVAPVLPDRRAALSTLTARGRLIRLDDDQLRILQFVPPGVADEQERKVVGPRFEFDERELPVRKDFVDPFQEVPRVFEADDLLLVPEDQFHLPKVQLLVEPREVFRRERELERTETRVDVFEDRIEFERLRHAEAQPVRKDAGHGLVWRSAAFRDERRIAARIGGNAVRKHGLRRRHGQTEVDETSLGVVHEDLDLARLRRRGRSPGFLLRFLRRGFGLRGLLGRRGLRGRRSFRLFLRLLRFLFWLPLLWLVFLPESEGHVPRKPGWLVIRVVL